MTKLNFKGFAEAELKQVPLTFLVLTSIDLDERGAPLESQRTVQPDNLYFNFFLHLFNCLWRDIGEEQSLKTAEEEAHRRNATWMELFTLCHELLMALKAVAGLATLDDQVFMRDQYGSLIDGHKQKPSYPLRMWSYDKKVGKMCEHYISEPQQAAILKPYNEALDAARVTLMDKVIHSPQFEALMALHQKKFTYKHVQQYEQKY